MKTHSLGKLITIADQLDEHNASNLADHVDDLIKLCAHTPKFPIQYPHEDKALEIAKIIYRYSNKQAIFEQAVEGVELNIPTLEFFVEGQLVALFVVEIRTIEQAIPVKPVLIFIVQLPNLKEIKKQIEQQLYLRVLCLHL